MMQTKDTRRMAFSTFFLLGMVIHGLFCTVTYEELVVDDNSLNFLVIGDWGGLPYSPYRTVIERAVADGMGKVAEGINAKFIVALGDNFYYDGVKDAGDPRFKETYEDVYHADSLHVPWYIVAGNHDHHRNVTAQIVYSQKSERWNFPNLYYTKIFKITGIAKTVQFVLIDTVILCGDSGHDDHHKQPQGARSEKEANDQLSWIEETLKNSTADYLIVGGHYPVWSVAEHGPTECLLETLRPLLQRYQVTTYLCGHDHNLQHLKESNSSVDYFVVGAANFINPSVEHMDSVPKDSCQFYWADLIELGGFAMASVKEDSMLLSFVDSAGKVLYSKKMLPRKEILNLT